MPPVDGHPKPVGQPNRDHRDQTETNRDQESVKTGQGPTETTGTTTPYRGVVLVSVPVGEPDQSTETNATGTKGEQ